MWMCLVSLLTPKGREYWDGMGVVVSVGSELTSKKGNKEWWGSAKFGTVLPHLDLKTEE